MKSMMVEQKYRWQLTLFVTELWNKTIQCGSIPWQRLNIARLFPIRRVGTRTETDNQPPKPTGNSEMQFNYFPLASSALHMYTPYMRLLERKERWKLALIKVLNGRAKIQTTY